VASNLLAILAAFLEAAMTSYKLGETHPEKMTTSTSPSYPSTRKEAKNRPLAWKINVSYFLAPKASTTGPRPMHV